MLCIGQEASQSLPRILWRSFVSRLPASSVLTSRLDHCSALVYRWALGGRTPRTLLFAIVSNVRFQDAS